MAVIGFIGLGHCAAGRPMLRNLLKSGYTVIAYDSFTQALDGSVADGAQRAASSKDVASQAEIVITMVPDGPQVEEVVLGPNGVLEGAKAGTLVNSRYGFHQSGQFLQEGEERGVRGQRR